MPKMKTNKAAARRFKITGTGKILRRQAGKRHLNEWKSANDKRNLRGWAAFRKESEEKRSGTFPLSAVRWLIITFWLARLQNHIVASEKI